MVLGQDAATDAIIVHSLHTKPLIFTIHINFLHQSMTHNEWPTISPNIYIYPVPIIPPSLSLPIIIATDRMKANTAFVPNKKLILHFDVQQVLALPNDVDKDLFVPLPSYRSTNSAPNGSGAVSSEPAKKTPTSSRDGN